MWLYNCIVYLINQKLETNLMTQNNTEKFHFFHLLPSLAGGGAETVALTYHRALLKKNYKSTILLLRNKIDYDIEDVKDSVIVLSKRVHITYIKQLDEFILAKRIEKIASQSSGIPVIIASLEASYNVSKHIRRFFVINVIQNSLQEKITRWETSNPGKAKRHLENFRMTLNNSNVIGSSKGLISDLIDEMGIKPANCELIYNPIDIDDILIKSNAFIPEIKGKYILHAARIHEQKRHDIMLKAYELVKTPIDLVFLTNEPDELQKLIGTHPKKNNIHVFGFQKNYFPWLKNASLFVLSSQREGLPTVLLNSLACKIPTVSTDCKSGPNEILTGELSNYLAEVNNPKSLAEKIDLALEKYPEIRSEYLTKFSLNESLTSLIAFCDRLVEIRKRLK